MQTKQRQGQFEVIDSFAIKRRKEFYLIGKFREGSAQENWFVNIPLNAALSITLRITAVEEVEIANESKVYQLLIVSGNENELGTLLGLRIGNELLDVTIEGSD